jgi:hypothetical protein
MIFARGSLTRPALNARGQAVGTNIEISFRFPLTLHFTACIVREPSEMGAAKRAGTRPRRHLNKWAHGRGLLLLWGVDDLGMCAEDEAKPMPGIVGLSLLGEGLGVLRRGQDAKSGLGRWPRGGGTCVWGQPRGRRSRVW